MMHVFYGIVKLMSDRDFIGPVVAEKIYYPSSTLQNPSDYFHIRYIFPIILISQ
jgi:hypothetical protein